MYMLGADEVSPRFERWVAGTEPDRALRRAGIRFLSSAIYLIATARLDVTSPAQWLMATGFVAIPVTIPSVRRLLVDTLPFVIFAAVYDWLHLARSFVVAHGVHVAGPYAFDKWLFGIGTGPGRLSLNELFERHHWAAVDVVTGFAYFSYIYAVLGFVLFLAFADRSAAGAARTRALGWTFLGVNVASFGIYLAFPVAPPWYVTSHGFGPVDPNTAASAAALLRFDALVGVSYFQRFYGHSSDVFGAMPSMHCAYPMLLLLYGRELERPRLFAGLVVFQAVMCFSAVYLQHHYVSDILAGAACAMLGYRLERALGRRVVTGPREATAPAEPPARLLGAPEGS